MVFQAHAVCRYRRRKPFQLHHRAIAHVPFGRIKCLENVAHHGAEAAEFQNIESASGRRDFLECDTRLVRSPNIVTEGITVNTVSIMSM